MPKITLKTSLVLNRCYGGYSLSDEVSQELASRKGVTLKKRYGFLTTEDYQRLEEIVPRNDPDLVELVLAYGDKADGKCSKLTVKHLILTIEITDHDGMEWVAHSFVTET